MKEAEDMKRNFVSALFIIAIFLVAGINAQGLLLNQKEVKEKREEALRKDENKQNTSTTDIKGIGLGKKTTYILGAFVLPICAVMTAWGGLLIDFGQAGWLARHPKIYFLARMGAVSGSLCESWEIIKRFPNIKYKNGARNIGIGCSLLLYALFELLYIADKMQERKI